MRLLRGTASVGRPVPPHVPRPCVDLVDVNGAASSVGAALWNLGFGWRSFHEAIERHPRDSSVPSNRRILTRAGVPAPPWKIGAMVSSRKSFSTKSGCPSRQKRQRDRPAAEREISSEDDDRLATSIAGFDRSGKEATGDCHRRQANSQTRGGSRHEELERSGELLQRQGRSKVLTHGNRTWTSADAKESRSMEGEVRE